MKLHISKTLAAVAIMSVAMGAVNAAEPVIESVGSIDAASYSKTWVQTTPADKIVKYDSIKSAGIVDIASVALSSCAGYNYSYEFGDIEAGQALIIRHNHSGDITLSNIQALDYKVSTTKGNITVTGTCRPSENGSTISIAGSGENGTIRQSDECCFA